MLIDADLYYTHTGLTSARNDNKHDQINERQSIGTHNKGKIMKYYNVIYRLPEWEYGYNNWNFFFFFDNVGNLSKEEPFKIASSYEQLTPLVKTSCQGIHEHSPLTG